MKVQASVAKFFSGVHTVSRNHVETNAHVSWIQIQAFVAAVWMNVHASVAKFFNGVQTFSRNHVETNNHVS